MIDIEHLKSWIGRTEEASDVATASPIERLAALLDHDTPPWRANELPPLAHWLYFLPCARQSEIGEDGHPKRGGFLPPVPLPRRMWAGSRIEFLAPVPIGCAMTKRSTIQSVGTKTGSNGEMVFVTVRRETAAQDVPAIVEEQDIVYRDAPKSGTRDSAKPVPSDTRISEWTRTIIADPVQLFRYSALTFNGHRIHYDRDYAREVEGYPGLVVHGPYTATLLVNHFLRRYPTASVSAITFRARRPLFEARTFDLSGRKTEAGAELWARNTAGEIAMDMSIKASSTYSCLSNG